ncbi:hypothetical protein F5B20DRAFT_523677 [Whalleya microplaca]|nr:hypothetical protein F5B20DRAFT_523677 [Whalleya microplaca]
MFKVRFSLEFAIPNSSSPEDGAVQSAFTHYVKSNRLPTHQELAHVLKISGCKVPDLLSSPDVDGASKDYVKDFLSSDPNVGLIGFEALHDSFNRCNLWLAVRPRPTPRDWIRFKYAEFPFPPRKPQLLHATLFIQRVWESVESPEEEGPFDRSALQRYPELLAKLPEDAEPDTIEHVLTLVRAWELLNFMQLSSQHTMKHADEGFRCSNAHCTQRNMPDVQTCRVLKDADC